MLTGKPIAKRPLGRLKHRSDGLPNTIRMIKSSRLRWADDAVRMEEGRSAF